MAKRSPNYCALPAMGDALAWAYRKDGCKARPAKAFNDEYGYS